MNEIVAHLVESQSAIGKPHTFALPVKSFPAAKNALHYVLEIAPGKWSPPVLECATIVSHLSLGWWRLPLLVGLRAANPSALLVHVEKPGVPREAGVSRLDLLRSCYALFDRVIVADTDQAEWLMRHRLVDRDAVISNSTTAAETWSSPTVAGGGAIA